MSTLNFDVFWRDYGAAKGITALSNSAESAHGHVSKLSSEGPKLATAFVGFAAVEVFKGFIESAQEANRESRITANVIASTGGAAHVTAGQVDELTRTLSEKDGVDHNVIRTGANMLLTFTGIRNEVGKGNDIYDQATAAVTDMAAAMNNGQVTTDGVKAASIQLGKALNDPIKGTSALQRVGVSFTAQQKDQIKTLVASGHTLEAQKIILGEVQKEFGGTAAAAADPMQRLSVITKDLGEQVGQALLPAVTDFADFMTNTGAPAISTFVGILSHIPAPVYAVGAGLIALTGTIKAGRVVVESYKQTVEGVEAALKIFGLRAEEAAAAEVAEAAGAKEAAVSTAAAGDSAAVAGTKFGALAGKLALGGAVVGLAALSVEADKWLNRGNVAAESTDKLSSSLLQMQATGKASGAAFDLLNVHQSRFMAHINTSTDAMNRFGSEARGAFSMGWADIIGRAQTGTERVDTFNATAAQMDAALANLVRSGHAQQAAQIFDQLTHATGLTGDELQHVKARFGQYTAAAAQAAAASDAVAKANAQTNDVLRGTSSNANFASTTLHALAAANNTVTTSAHANHLAEVKLEQDLATLADRTLTLRGADRDLAAAKDDLTASLKTNGRGMSDNTAKGRANGAALDQVAQATLKSLAAHRASGEPLRAYAQQVDAVRNSLISEAERAGMSRTAAIKYADAILAVPRKQTTAYNTPGLAAARAGARGLASDIAHINGRTVTVKYQADGKVLIQARGTTAIARAAGGWITGPGGPREDRVPAMLSPGEFVVNAAAASQHAQLLEGLNAQRLAAGGPVTTRYAGSFAPTNIMSSFIDAWAAGGASAAAGGGGSFPIPAGSGVARWAPLVRRVLAMEGLAGGLLGRVLSQMNTESGGNPRAINLWDINAQHGDPSKGLMQVIGATFRAFHWPGTSSNIYDPLANIAAALNYARHRYGSGLSALGQGHGYAAGTMNAAPGWHKVGERGVEWVRFRGGEQVVPGQRPPMTGGGGSVATVNVNLQITGSAAGLEDRVVGAVRTAVRSGRLNRAVLPGVQH